MFIAYKANLNAQTSEGDTPFSIALKENQIDILDKFVDNVKLSENPKLIHNFTEHILDERYRSLLITMINKEKLQHEVINVLDKDGFTPFLAFLKHFAESFPKYDIIMRKELEYE